MSMAPLFPKYRGFCSAVTVSLDCLQNNTIYINPSEAKRIETRWLYCVECPQYSTRLEALGYLCDCLSGRVQRWQVVKVIWHKAHRRRRRMVYCYSTGDGNVPCHEGTLVKPFLHSWRQKVPIIYNGRPYPLELPLQMGIWTPRNTQCLGPMRAHNPNGTSIGSAMFAQMTAECPYTLQWFACFLLKIAPSHVGIWTSCNTWFIGPTRVMNPNGNLIVQPFFQDSLVWQTGRATDRPTDRPRYSVRCDVIMRNYVGYGKATYTRFTLVRTISPLLSRYLNV